MTKARRNILYTTLAAALLLVGCICFGLWGKWQLDNKHIISTGTIYDYSIGGRGHAGELLIFFKYRVNGQEHDGTSTYTDYNFNITKDFIGKTFPIVYNPDHPLISKMLIIPSDFAGYNYSFPDSLKWVKQFIR